MSAPILRLDHIIIRSATPEKTLAELSERGGMPIHVPVQPTSGLLSGIARGGDIDVEVVALGEPPISPVGYGFGFTAPEGFDDAVRGLRAAGIATSPAPWAQAEDRRWRAAQMHGLLPDPFPAPTTTRDPGLVDRISESIGGVLVRIPAVARAATRRAGSSMVVLTEYGFDAEAVRARANPGSNVAAVRVGTAGHHAAWEALDLGGRVPLHLDDAATGLTEVVLDGSGDSFAIGSVMFHFQAGI